MDSTLLSKIELGQRLPTETQLQALASFFKISFEELEVRRLAERFWKEYGSSPAAKEVVNLIQEQAAEYTISKRGIL
jgi:transcriptional regulator with XRE-family HTH domain